MNYSYLMGVKDVSELSKYIAGRYENLHNGHFAFIN